VIQHGSSFPANNLYVASKVFDQGVKFYQFGIPLPPLTPAVMSDGSGDGRVCSAYGAPFIACPFQNRVCDVAELAALLWSIRLLGVTAGVLWSPWNRIAPIKKRAPIFSVPSPEPLNERSAVGAQLPNQLCLRDYLMET
jgi:hypothetical protein